MQYLQPILSAFGVVTKVPVITGTTLTSMSQTQDPNITWSSLFRSTHPWLLYEKTKSTIIQLFFPLYPQRGRDVLPLPYGLFKPFCGTLNELFYDLPLDLPSDQIFVWILSFFQCVRSSLSTWFTVFFTLTQSINWSILGLINLGSNSFF